MIKTIFKKRKSWYRRLTSKPIELEFVTFKADLAVFVNSNMLITKIIGKSAQWL